MTQAIRRGSSRRHLLTATTAEADHRIANSLSVIASLVRVRASKGHGAADPAAFLKEIANRIDTVAKLHHHIARSRTGVVQLNAYLQETCDALHAALAQPATSFSVACPADIIVPFSMALPLGLMTAELCSNSLKYAHPTGLPVKIALSCVQPTPHELTFGFEDDGVGFPENFDALRDGHLGMQFIRMLSEQLGAAPKWTSDPLGICFEMTMTVQSADYLGATTRYADLRRDAASPADFLG